MLAPPFVLLEDFTEAYDRFSLKVPSLDDRLAADIRDPMVDALQGSVGSLRRYDLETIREYCREYSDGAKFVITMEGQFFGSFAVERLDVTRAIFDLSRVYEGPYVRHPREGERMFVTQGLRLREQYQNFGRSRSIVLFDDGIGTGESLRRVVGLLLELGLSVDRIAVLVNPSGTEEVRDIPVHTLLPETTACVWLNERDLYWGLPRSGVSYVPDGETEAVAGIPYSVDERLLTTRMDLTTEQAKQFRPQCLEINRQFWLYLEKEMSRELTLRDCRRLAHFASRFGGGDRRVVEVIDEVSDADFQFSR